MAVYFIQAGEYIKIGTSGDPKRRLANLQSGHYLDLSLVHVAPGGEDEERLYHRMFADYHVRGEWYERDPILARILETPSCLELDKGEEVFIYKSPAFYGEYPTMPGDHVCHKLRKNKNPLTSLLKCGDCLHDYVVQVCSQIEYYHGTLVWSTSDSGLEVLKSSTQEWARDKEPNIPNYRSFLLNNGSIEYLHNRPDLVDARDITSDRYKLYCLIREWIANLDGRLILGYSRWWIGRRSYSIPDDLRHPR